ncbi:MAG TPA: PAS domain-containing sensor histidine kinase [Candidatus Limnocylindrales bacterium]|nr:PAS domain-containing sensor histidine kinase [Candidatus Limnocylindrales bacterium]
MSGTESSEAADLRAQVAALEAETRRAFEDAQREADTLFAQYQLSQLLASGGTPAALGDAVAVELARLAGAVAGAIWLGDMGRPGLALVAASGSFDAPPPARFDGVDGDGSARAWAAGREDVTLVVLGDAPPATVLALRRGERPLDADGLRIAQLARHEIAVAFGGARLRESLERERSELGAVVDGATDVILQVDPDRRVTRLNPAGARALGVRAEDAIGRSCDDLLGCLDAGSHGPDACPFAEVLSTGRPIDYREAAIRGAGGGSIRVAGGYSRSDGGGAGPRATGILRDISAIRALEELREGFVATVSHELRTPLALVRGYAETVLHLELDPAEQRAYVERIHQVSARLTDLVTQILDVTHLDADPLILERAPATFAALVARLRGDLVLAGEDGRLVADLPPDLPPLEVDAGRVGRILENLVGNALKYAPADTPVVVGATVEGDWLVATVDDEGIGIPEAERALVTEPFHRAWNVRESRIPGTGLGLYICRRLVEAHGGRLTVGDRPDGRPGTRVSFTLPLLAGSRRHPARPPTVTAGG